MDVGLARIIVPIQGREGGHLGLKDLGPFLRHAVAFGPCGSGSLGLAQGVLAMPGLCQHLRQAGTQHHAALFNSNRLLKYHPTHCTPRSS